MRSPHPPRRRFILLAFVLGTSLGVAMLWTGLHRVIAAQPEAQTPASAALEGGSEHPAQTQGWVETRLYFGIGPAAGDAGAAEARWRKFLDEEVTPRFPAGLSIVDVYGQWRRGPEKPPERERSRMLIVDYPATPRNAARIEAIRAAWKQLTGDQSVLKVTQPADVSF
jgi:hypothetical protein